MIDIAINAVITIAIWEALRRWGWRPAIDWLRRWAEKG